MAETSQIDRAVTVAIIRAMIGIGVMWVVYLVWLATSRNTQRVLSPEHVTACEATYGAHPGPHTWSMLVAPILGLAMVSYHGTAASRISTVARTPSNLPTWSRYEGQHPIAEGRFDEEVISGDYFSDVWDQAPPVAETPAPQESGAKSRYRVSSLEGLPDLGL